MPARVVVAMSGGVDSSVAAYLLKEQGYEVFGLTMRTGAHWPPEDAPERPHACCDAANIASACRVAEHLGIALHTVDFGRHFRSLVERFCREYLQGRTPNPCAVCNSELKFGYLWRYARRLRAGYIATGHYARVETVDGRPVLCRGVDAAKDQSYFLFGLSRQVLAHVLLPLGCLTKPEVRRLAREAGLPVHERPDSQEICFVPDDDYRALLQRRYGPMDTAGPIVDLSGRVVGQHGGFERFTVGQRRRLRVPMGEPHYVVRIEPVERRVVIGPRRALEHRGAVVADVNWLADDGAGGACRILGQIRYRHRAAPATLVRTAADAAEVVFDAPQSAITPGQALVFYDADRVLGGGWIQRSFDP